MSTLFQDTRYSYYQLLAKRLLEGNQMFSVATTKRGCYTGKSSHRAKWQIFERWANATAKSLRSYTGNLIPIDESLLDGFPETRPPMCMPLDSTGVMLDKDGFKTNDPKLNVIRSSNGDNLTYDWTRAWYWKAKKRDYYIYKEKIDKMLQRLQQQIPLTKVTPVITEPTIDNTTALTVTSGLVPLGILGILLLYSSGGKS